MKWLKCWVIIILFVGIKVFANEPLQFRLTLIGNDTIVYNKLGFGFHPEATDGLDTALGELDLPPMLPPSGYKLYGVFIFYDSTQQSNIWSYLDLRPFPSNSTDTVRFLLYAIRESGIKLRLYWNAIGDEVRYAWLVDEYLGTLVQVDMKKTNYVNIENEFLDKFYIKMVLANVNGVNIENNNNIIYYSENSDEIVLKSESENDLFCRIYDVLGNVVAEFSFQNSKRIPSYIFSKGIYFVELNYLNGKKVVKKIVVY